MKKLCALALSLLAVPALADNNHGFYSSAGVSSLKGYQDGIDNVSRIRAAEFF